MNRSEGLELFTQYLKSKGMTDQTIIRYRQMLSYFLDWKRQEGLTDIDYSDLLIFIKRCHKEGKSTIRINKYLLAVRHYMDDRVKRGKSKVNPAIGLQIRGVQHNLKRGFLTRGELEELEKKYTGKHKLMLSLVVNQGLTVSELEKLEPCHLNLYGGTIYIPKGRKNSSRTLSLEAKQVLQLLEAKQSGREKLVSDKPLKNAAFALCRELEKINGKVQNLRQLRASVIVHWLKTENLRQVQYKAGHKNVNSTEMYLQENLENLKKQLNKHHPLQ